MLKNPALGESKRLEYAKAINGTASRQAGLISNILKLNKLENQQIFAKNEEYDLSEQLCEILLSFENIWEEKEIEIETDIPDSVKVFADCELLSLVWNNLLSNAFKFTDKGGKVSLSLCCEENEVTVKITDTGCGMSSETGAHIFEKLYQGDTSHSAQGNGLGLALVKKVVDIVHGEIGVESVLGEGTDFTVKLRRR